jgi:predicted nuclease of predicted toxin-antitoxin system
MTKDADFFGLLSRGVLRTTLVWVRCGNAGPRALWAVVEPRLPDILNAINAGDRLIEIGRP